MENRQIELIQWFENIDINDISRVGGKNASIGEMYQNLTSLGINIPNGFATTAKAYRLFIEENKLEKSIHEELEKYRTGSQSLQDTGFHIREYFHKSIFPISIAEAIRSAYERLCEARGEEDVLVAVRSSATAEDLPSASFAGLHETFLNVRGKEQIIEMCKECYGSLFTDRAITYREEKGFDHLKVSLSIGIQSMVHANESGSGVMFTLDTETGYPDVVLINAAWGLGENIVQGTITPDQYMVFKPVLDDKSVYPIIEKRLGSKEQKLIYTDGNGNKTKNVATSVQEQSRFVLTDKELLQLARWGVQIEKHYDKPMDIEWVKDDNSGNLYIVQASPETVHTSKKMKSFKSYSIYEDEAKPILIGIGIGNAVTHGKVRHVNHISDIESIEADTIIVTQMTEPDWIPAMKHVKGIITDSGGRTCHAAIISREMGIPAIVGTRDATKVLQEGKKITLSCAGGDMGAVYNDYLEFNVDVINLEKLPKPNTKIMINLATPETAFKWWKLPIEGVGLARMEFIISNHIKIHPLALLHFDQIIEDTVRKKIRKLTKHYKSKKEFFIDKLSEGIAKIAASQYPKPVIVRTSDFKTNEYAGLIGGKEMEPDEENPMLGWRGASRYYSEGYKEGFALECLALKKVREEMGLNNVVVMIPFCRRLSEAEKVLDEMKKNGLDRGKNNLQVYMMCEIPSNVILAEKFAQYFDGFSIGSNDLTQLILGVDRDSSELSHLFDEEDEAVKISIQELITKAHNVNCPVGFCGQAPSDKPKYTNFLVQNGIDSISVNPDSVVQVLERVYEAESLHTSSGSLIF